MKSWRLIGSKLGVLGVPKYWGWEGGGGRSLILENLVISKSLSQLLGGTP